MKIKFTRTILGLIGTCSLGTASFYGGYHIFLKSWPSEVEDTKAPKLSFAAQKTKMDEFQEGIVEGRDYSVTLADVPMPGTTMVGSHPDDHAFWKLRSEVLKREANNAIPHQIDKLQKWCSTHLKTRIYVRKDGKNYKYKSFLEDTDYVNSITQLVDLYDVRVNCSRLVTYAEFYEDKKFDKDHADWKKHKCDNYLNADYVSTKTTPFNQYCSKIEKKD